MQTSQSSPCSILNTNLSSRSTNGGLLLHLIIIILTHLALDLNLDILLHNTGGDHQSRVPAPLPAGGAPLLSGTGTLISSSNAVYMLERWIKQWKVVNTHTVHGLQDWPVASYTSKNWLQSVISTNSSLEGGSGSSLYLMASIGITWLSFHRTFNTE